MSSTPIGIADRATLLERGWIAIPDVVPRALCEAVVASTAKFLGVDPDDRRTWFATHRDGHGIVPLHHGQALWNVRQHPDVHAVFAELLGTEALWVSMDRVSFKPPSSGWTEPYRESDLHWDTDPRRYDQFGVQGAVYLRDTDADQGAFCCVPDIYRNLASWLEVHAERSFPADAVGLPVERIPGTAGTLVVWHRLMPHSSGRNDGAEPRWTQYVTMDPASDDETRRAAQAAAFLGRRAPEWAIRQNVPGQLDPELGPTAELTALGRKLAGLYAW